jgi:AcrR family transcriptional regulator
MKVDHLLRIRQAAAIIANKRGLAGLSMNGLAESLGVGSPSLYVHVKGIAEVERLLGLDGFAALSERVMSATVGKSGPEAVRALLTALRDFIRESPGFYDATLLIAPADDLEWNKAAKRLGEIYLAVFQTYNLDRVNAIHALRGLLSVAHGFSYLEHRWQTQGVDPDETFAWLVDSYVAAIEHVAAYFEPTSNTAGQQ